MAALWKIAIYRVVSDVISLTRDRGESSHTVLPRALQGRDWARHASPVKGTAKKIAVQNIAVEWRPAIVLSLSGGSVNRGALQPSWSISRGWSA